MQAAPGSPLAFGTFFRGKRFPLPPIQEEQVVINASINVSPRGERRDSHRELDNFEKLGSKFLTHEQVCGVQNSTNGPSNLLYELILKLPDEVSNFPTLCLGSLSYYRGRDFFPV